MSDIAPSLPSATTEPEYKPWQQVQNLRSELMDLTCKKCFSATIYRTIAGVHVGCKCGDQNWRAPFES